MNPNSIIHEVRTDRKAVAITFDDGPNPEYTPQIIRLFEQFGAKATFYVIGKQLEEYRDVALSAHQAGHELGNHTYSHPHLTKLDEAQQLSELERTDRYIRELCGQSPKTFRPPYLDFDHQIGLISKKLGYAMIGAGNLQAEDWRMPGVDHIMSATRDCIKSGSIVLFHDGYGDRSQTVEAVRILLPELKANGYELVTVSELLQLSDTII